MGTILVLTIIGIPVVLAAVLMALADLAPETFARLEHAIARIPGLQRAWGAYYRAFMAVWRRLNVLVAEAGSNP